MLTSTIFLSNHAQAEMWLLDGTMKSYHTRAFKPIESLYCMKYGGQCKKDKEL